jgi:hypothetical protein
MNQLRRFFLQIMIAFALSAAELGRGGGDLRCEAVVRIIPPEPTYPPRYLPVRRRRLYEGFDGEMESARLYVTSRFN